jgi:hypothetical protein
MERAGDVLKEILLSLLKKEHAKTGENFHKVFANWQQIVGKKLSYHSAPIDIKNNSLYIEVDHPGWLQLFQFNGPQIIKKIRSLYSQLDIHSLKYKIKSKKTKNETNLANDDTSVVDLSIKKENLLTKKNGIGDKIMNTEMQDLFNTLYKSISKTGDKS